MTNIIRPASFVGNPGHQPMLTANKNFNKHADYIADGNVYSNVQSSTYVRARQNRECNGFAFPPGQLQKFNLDSIFGTDADMVQARRFIENDDFFETNGGIAYRIFHYNSKVRIVHGVIITNQAFELVRCFHREDLGHTRSEKSNDVLRFSLQYLTVPALQTA